ncbi:carbohydrate sulfotransferase 11-like isoform X2 [Scylla paramamosain]|uniref:carbohydrate sulfotransferase 11-like isoform X2 n=1 Tax=Scylla paramamosain TaxID=85552 RepID=UPI003082C14E
MFSRRHRVQIGLRTVTSQVASTTLVSSLMAANGQPLPLPEGTSPHVVAEDTLTPKTDNEFEFARKHFFKFLLVRHPFSRLLSAYRDKVEAAQHWSLKQMREHIFTTLAEANLTERRPNDDSKNSDDIPTFRDFLEYILITKYTGGGFDSHWAPYWHLCSPCFIQYDAVAKLETAQTDLKYIWHHMRLKETVPWINRSSQSSSSGSTVNHYYQSLSPDLIARVYRRYRLDFEMFQYEILDVVREGGHCQLQDCSDMIPFFS